MGFLCSLSTSDLGRLFGHEYGDVLLVVTSRSVRSLIAIDHDGSVEVIEYDWTGPQARRDLLTKLAALRSAGQRASVLWIADDEFEHYRDEEIAGCKVAAISGFSVPLTAASLTRILEIVAITDFALEQRLEKTFLDQLDSASRIRLTSPQYSVEAVFEHHRAEHWFSLHGALDWGQQMVLPTGEISALVNGSGAYDEICRFALDGELVLLGQPIVHRGASDISLEVTARAYSDLATMRTHAVIATVREGLIEELRSAVPGRNPFLTGLERLLASDPRYRKIHEIGFGTNFGCAKLVDSNWFANERYPGVHLGIGLGSFTPFHIDLVSTMIKTYFEHPDGHRVDLYGLLNQVSRART